MSTKTRHIKLPSIDQLIQSFQDVVKEALPNTQPKPLRGNTTTGTHRLKSISRAIARATRAITPDCGVALDPHEEDGAMHQEPEQNVNVAQGHSRDENEVGLRI